MSWKIYASSKLKFGTSVISHLKNIMKYLGLDINSREHNHISLFDGLFFNQENNYEELCQHLVQHNIYAVIIGNNGYGSKRHIHVIKKIIKRLGIQVYFIDEKSTSVICSSCGFRKIKKGKLIPFAPFLSLGGLIISSLEILSFDYIVTVVLFFVAERLLFFLFVLF